VCVCLNNVCIGDAVKKDEKLLVWTTDVKTRIINSKQASKYNIYKAPLATETLNFANRG